MANGITTIHCENYIDKQVVETTFHITKILVKSKLLFLVHRNPCMSRESRDVIKVLVVMLLIELNEHISEHCYSLFIGVLVVE